MSSFLNNKRNMKFIKKYMKLAKLLGETENPCYSRQIGVIIVSSNFNNILATGYNGPPRNIPHCDTKWHYKKILLPQINNSDKIKIAQKLRINKFCEKTFINTYCDKKICPRKILDCASGERLQLCSCVHAEANAVINAQKNLANSTMFAWCPLPCVECTKVIINSGIKKLFCYKEESDYSISSRPLFLKSGIEFFELEKNQYLTK